MSLPADLTDRLTIPLIAAPMTGVCGPELVAAACRNGVIGAFPTHNAADSEKLDDWLTRLRALPADAAPIAPNLVVHRTNARLTADLDRLRAHRPKTLDFVESLPLNASGKVDKRRCAHRTGPVGTARSTDRGRQSTPITLRYRRTGCRDARARASWEQAT